MSTDDGTGDTLYSSAIFGVSVNMYIVSLPSEQLSNYKLLNY